ncbi:kinase [Elizabethkingia meningoseptica]|uniref:kinase n=1 Tax=Elizabethkingia meningoseptica TaxID=238 RepID=UPI0023B19309|nr:kinase [Elizabethkingia meningoseptica]MDE5467947.1 kinase [Elizabethkingia meningoseptica]MDE5474866.1 kinase [Elizabethkingia meningoseptica]MDE5478299.1 kinase [Elizabethkingia meningoseptica]MDE5486698.1 kinase [Elizabethkingia meningoseptica]MDE5501710.1 kinase [Elizabethkingia meningoseptica]
MSNLLYYPYINVPRTDWTLRTLLYYDNIGSIVPQEYFYDPEKNYDSFMLELVRNELVTPINPLEVLNNPWETTQPFLELVERNRVKLTALQNSFQYGQRSNLHIDKFQRAHIHADKFDENIFYALEQLGLAERDERNWYSVEQKTANNLMSYLASIISAKTNRLPITDYVRPTFYRQSFSQERKKRETILTKLIPFPEEIDLKKLLKFKERNSKLLNAFRTKVEKIVLDPNIIENSPLFHQHLAELHQRKEELSAKMNESKFNSIMFGTVCGLIGASQGLVSASMTGTIIGGLPGFANAVYSALKIERAENVFDQSGLKYLALADKRLRR